MRLEHSHRKIDRANHHITEIKARLLDLRQSETSSIEINPTTRNEVLKHDFADRKILPDIALILGDAVHNLKCALDYAWFQTVHRMAPSAVGKFAKFPAYESVDKLKAALEGKQINITAPLLFDFMLNKIKPCNGGNPAIWPIHRLDIRDKHRLLIPVFTNAAIVDIEVQDERGNREIGHTFNTFQQAPFYLPMPLGVHVKKKGHLVYDVMVDQVGLMMDVPETFISYSNFIRTVIETFERFVK